MNTMKIDEKMGKRTPDEAWIGYNHTKRDGDICFRSFLMERYRGNNKRIQVVLIDLKKA